MKTFRPLLSRFSSLIQFILMLWVAMLYITCGYDAQAHTRSGYDAVVGAPCNYDAATTLAENERSSTPAGEVGFFSQPARFVAPNNAAQVARLSEHLRQLEKYGAGGARELQNGRIRYYSELNPARTPGEMVGRQTVREWDPTTGASRTWHETLDQAGRVRIVRPETGGTKVHYVFDERGNYTGTF